MWIEKKYNQINISLFIFQMGTCVYCKTMVPFNTPTCVVCEGPIPNQNQPMASIKLADKLVCLLCGTANPAHLTQCVTCDTPLPITGLTKVLNGETI